MKNYIIKLMALGISLMLMSIGQTWSFAANENLKALFANRGVAQDGVELTAILADNVINTGSKIKLDLYLTNFGDKSKIFYFGQPDCYSLCVIDDNGNEITPKAQDDRFSILSQNVGRINPGETYCSSSSETDDFTFNKPGQYRIIAFLSKRMISMINHDIVSNSVIFNVSNNLSMDCKISTAISPID